MLFTYLWKLIFTGSMEDDPSVESEGKAESQRVGGGRSYLNLTYIHTLMCFDFIFSSGLIVRYIVCVSQFTLDYNCLRCFDWSWFGFWLKWVWLPPCELSLGFVHGILLLLVVVLLFYEQILKGIRIKLNLTKSRDEHIFLPAFNFWDIVQMLIKSMLNPTWPSGPIRRKLIGAFFFNGAR